MVATAVELSFFDNPTGTPANNEFDIFNSHITPKATIVDSIWTADTAEESLPVCYLMNTKPRAEIKLNTTRDLTLPCHSKVLMTIRSEMGGGYGPTNVTFQTFPATVSLTATTNLPNNVGGYRDRPSSIALRPLTLYNPENPADPRWILAGAAAVHPFAMFRVAAAPTAPMATPWWSVLYWTCGQQYDNGWAWGANTVNSLCTKVTQEVNEGDRVAWQYDTSYGRPYYTEDDEFDLTLCLNEMWEGTTDTEDINCTDVAHIVGIFSNAAGASLTLGKMEHPSGSYQLEDILPIRRTWASGLRFNFHHAARDSSEIYDACLKLEPRPDGVLATGMSWSTYADKLVDDAYEDDMDLNADSWLPIE